MMVVKFSCFICIWLALLIPVCPVVQPVLQIDV